MSGTPQPTTSGPGSAPVDTVGAASGSEPTMSGPEPAQVATLAIAHIGALNIDVLVTTWDDGTGELAYRPGREQTSFRWSAPVPLEVAP